MINITIDEIVVGKYAANKFSPNISCDLAIRNCTPIVLSKLKSPHHNGIIQFPLKKLEVLGEV